MRFDKLYECDVCLRSDSVCVLPLVGYERILAANKLIKDIKPQIPLMRHSLEASDICLKKLHFVKLCLLRASKKQTRFASKMHFKPSSPAKEEAETPNAEEEFRPEYYFPTTAIQAQDTFPYPGEVQSSASLPTPVVCTNDYDCKCQSCQNKYGSLPVLLQGIEQKYETDKTDPRPSTSSEKATAKRTMSCEYCQKSFTHKGDFNKHLRKHTREKPFSCPVCQRQFAHTSNLLRHQRLHSGDKPFLCEQCDKSFSRKDKLDSHRRSRMCQGTPGAGNS